MSVLRKVSPGAVKEVGLLEFFLILQIILTAPPLAFLVKAVEKLKPV